MGVVNESKLGTVRTLIQAAPDSAIRSLAQSLSGSMDGQEAMRLIRGIVTDEAGDRRGRDAVFAPIVPLFGPVLQTGRTVCFPSAALKRIWLGLKLEAPDETHQAIERAHEDMLDTPSAIQLLDGLCRKAAAGLRAQANPEYAAAAAILTNVSPEGLDALAAYVELTPVARAALERLPEWLGRLNDERSAAARVAFKDAVDVSEDSGPRLLEILYAHLPEPRLILRLINAVMHRPVDRYVATSELASFGERLMDDIDRRIEGVTAFSPNQGVEGAQAAANEARQAALLVAEFDEQVDLSREGPWGRRLAAQKSALSLAAETWLKRVEAETVAALPLHTAAKRRGVARGLPRLTHEPNLEQVARAQALLAYMQAMRPSAERLGFASVWTRTAESVEANLDSYAEHLLEIIHARDPEIDEDRARRYLEIAAEFLALASDENAAQIVRRRAAAA